MRNRQQTPDGHHPDEISRLLQDGLRFYGEGDTDNAIACWKRVLELSPGNATAIDYLESAGVTLDAPGVQDSSRVVRLNPKNASPTNTAQLQELKDGAVAAVRNGLLEDALQMLHRAKELSPKDPEISRSIKYVRDRLIIRYTGEIGSLDQVPTRLVSLKAAQRDGAAPDALYLLDLIDGILTIDDLLSLSNLGQLRTLRALQHLVGRKFIEFRAPDTRPVSSPQGMDDADTAADTAVGYDDLYRAATAAYVRRDLQEARRLFEQCLRLRPDDTRARHNLDRIQKHGADI